MDSSRRRFRGVLFVVASVIACLFGTATSAVANGADGTYRIISASGRLSLKGESIKLTPEVVRKITGFEASKTSVDDGRLIINKMDMESLIQQLVTDATLYSSDLFVDGVKQIKLRKSGTAYKGQAKKTVDVYFEVYSVNNVTGALYLEFEANLRDNELTIRAAVDGSVNGKKLTGNLKIVCKRTKKTFLNFP